MFGIIRPCRHRLSEKLRTEWMAHLCGLCLALRGEHGQFARIATNYDGLVISVLVEAQAGRPDGWRRTAGPCPLRGMRTASVARGEGARLAATVSLVLASAKVRDHVVDGDGALARRPVAAAARRMAGRWDRSGERSGAALGFDTAPLLDAVGRQAELESRTGPGTPLLAVTEPTETATAAAFGHTAVLAGRPGNRAPLEEAGRLFGRLAHLLDAVEDLAEDAETGAWNPIAATGTDLAEVRRLCDDAVHGVRLALKDTRFAGKSSGRLAHVLLVHELERAVDRAFGATGCAHTGHATGTPESSYGPPPRSPWITPGGPGGAPPEPPHRRRGLIAGCLVWSGLFCTCQVCCRDPYHDPWTGQPREGLCHKCDDCCDCCDCCGNCGDCCNCCDCCDGCDCGCDC
ncbi:hypothetical protein IGW14_38070 [Streptomyces hygroscopicus subsp. hygroscopicus]|uniref:DUF5685 family protein n=1 Tax=Streptomyces hygroscopicus TaxID=1912 RepID=UPI001C654CAF|nr:DUF5685 family protein [Streptomyces hygroscopicus]MBW8093608.1 hypothetical protein [Streptomyces hygroscopicus subsp. hygroscopicus]